MDYIDKYIKYKTKYLELKNIDVNNQLGCGKDNLIIHVCGSSGSGKTTLGNKLKEKFKNKIIVKDLDELLDEHFVVHFGKNSLYNLGDVNEKLYQEYIDNYINKQSKPIIFVGLNDNFIDFYPKRKNIYYNLHNINHKYYIDIDNNIIVKQKCERFFNNIKNDITMMNGLITNNNKFIKQILKAFNTECNAKYIIKWINKWKKDYKNKVINL
jgi:adenylate kinase family enzyme